MVLETILDVLWTDARINRPLQEVEEEVDLLFRETLPTWLGITALHKLPPSHTHVVQGIPVGPHDEGLAKAISELLAEHYRVASSDDSQDRFALGIHIDEIVRTIFGVITLVADKDRLLRRQAQLARRRTRAATLRQKLSWLSWLGRTFTWCQKNPCKLLMAVAATVTAIATIVLVA